MVLGIITAVAACPAIIGTTEAVRSGQKQNQREKHRGRKCHLTVTLLKHSRYSPRFNGAPIVLRDGKLYVDIRGDIASQSLPEHFPATVNYLPYPDRKDEWSRAGYVDGEGLVTMISKERHLNWVYVDQTTHEVKYGVRAKAQPNLVGPWDCTKVDRRITFQGWEGFIAVQEDEADPDMWALYFDCADNGLTGEGQIGHNDKRMLEVEVWSKELRVDFDHAREDRAERLQSRKEIESS